MNRPDAPHPIAFRFPCLGSPRPVAALRSLRDDGPGTVADLAGRLGDNPAGLAAHLRTLRTAGLVHSVPLTPHGPGLLYRAADAGRAALAELDADGRKTA